jgi:hypothetical protein
MPRILYKYLDIDGAIAMLKNRTLRFSNATKQNDPFDCHPNLIDHSSAADGAPTEEWGRLMVFTEENKAENDRDNTWFCSLSKIKDSIPMWSYYGRNHTGVCIGLNIDKVLKNTPQLFGMTHLEPLVCEVQYKDILQRPSGGYDLWYYQLTTKAQDWAHEQEVRLVMPYATRNYLAYTEELLEREKRGEIIHDREFPRDMPIRDGECLEAIYLGIEINKEKKIEIIQKIKAINPNIKLYQMSVDENAFRLKAIEITK